MTHPSAGLRVTLEYIMMMASQHDDEVFSKPLEIAKNQIDAAAALPPVANAF